MPLMMIHTGPFSTLVATDGDHGSGLFISETGSWLSTFGPDVVGESRSWVGSSGNQYPHLSMVSVRVLTRSPWAWNDRRHIGGPSSYQQLSTGELRPVW